MDLLWVSRPGNSIRETKSGKNGDQPWFCITPPGGFFFFITHPGKELSLLLLLILGVFYTIRTNHSWIPMIIWPCIHWLAYTVMGVSGYFWYYAILIPGIIVATGLGLEAIGKYRSESQKTTYL